ncbi:hypothetical protein [Rhodanobacter hydrolyticus]|uniref:DUF1850 domain-containing protein n=1 Tax=Rhodanobacter hydrolyticus TaxID=2250595 RepID=A0ABW8J7V3_9GAMM
MKAFLALLLGLISPVVAAQGHGITVLSSGVVLEGGRHLLKMQVWNCTNHEIEVPLGELPWAGNTLGLVLYPGGKISGVPLKEESPIADFPATGIKIKAGGHIEGDAQLEPRFGDLSRYDKGDGLLVFWSYDVSWITGGEPMFAVGVVPLGKMKLVAPGRKAGCQ